MKRLLTVAQVAEILDCSQATVRRRIRAGKLKAWRDGGLVRVSEEALDAYLEAGAPEEPLARRRRRLVVGRSTAADMLAPGVNLAELPDLLNRPNG